MLINSSQIFTVVKLMRLIATLIVYCWSVFEKNERISKESSSEEKSIVNFELTHFENRSFSFKVEETAIITFQRNVNCMELHLERESNKIWSNGKGSYEIFFLHFGCEKKKKGKIKSYWFRWDNLFSLCGSNFFWNLSDRRK